MIDVVMHVLMGALSVGVGIVWYRRERVPVSDSADKALFEIRGRAARVLAAALIILGVAVGLGLITFE